MTAPPARLVLLLTALLAVAVAPLAAADQGSRVSDTAGDALVGELDIRALWIDTNDTLNLTFHLEVGSELRAPPAPTSSCGADGCNYAALSYRIIFRVLGADGEPLPTLADYNRSYVVYRHGTAGPMTSPVGAFVKDDVLQLNGTAAVTVDKAHITLRIPRSNPAVNMAVGPTPGATIDQVYAYDSPQVCDAEGCYATNKPGVDAEAAPGTGALTTSAQWDRAPDAGYANATVFPGPPATASPAATATPAPTPPPAPPAAPAPATPAAQPTPSPSGSASSTGSGAPDPGSKQSPGLAAPLGTLLVAAVALLRRRA